MGDDKDRKGYVVQLYQYARRYRYNNGGLLNLFNHALKYREVEKRRERYTLEQDYLTLGDFDVLQIVPVNSFREYHDVSELARDWLGKRQSVLLYDISDETCPSRMYYDEVNREWKTRRSNGNYQRENKKFFCLSMFSLTNEISVQTENTAVLLRLLRQKILSIVDKSKNSKACNVQCEVFGTFNTSEVGIFWLSDQYVDVLRIIDFIKHIKIKFKTAKEQKYTEEEEVSAFFTSFSIIAFKENIKTDGVKGKALVQIAVHDVMGEYNKLEEFAKEVLGVEDQNDKQHIFYSVGEYDLVIEVPASRAIDLLKKNDILSIGKRDKNGVFDASAQCRKFLRNNTRLLYNEQDGEKLHVELKNMFNSAEFIFQWEKELNNDIPKLFEENELKRSIGSEGNKYDRDNKESQRSNEDYFWKVRQELKDHVSPSAGAVDTLDLMYSDYHSVISSAYNALWVSDLHRQMKAVLHAIDLLISSEDIEWSWDWFRELTNAFKQQIYHLSQSSRLFFEIPSCHLRATGQFDFLMHAYYGMAKKIIEVIYLMQDHVQQPELVPLITVNAVPQVKSQLYFELGSLDSRVINLDIPNSIIFDIQRGICYLSHELFHYVVPACRAERNYYMEIFLLIILFKVQFLQIFCNLLSTKVDGMVDEKTSKFMKLLLQEGRINTDCSAEFYRQLSILMPEYIIENFQEQIQPSILCKSEKNDIGSRCISAVFEFTESPASETFFKNMFKALFPKLCKVLLKEDEEKGAEIQDIQGQKIAKRVKDRIAYCNKNEDYIEQFIQLNHLNRFFDEEKHQYAILGQAVWSAVREACSDVAMISLNHLAIWDYMLFCIQAWTDATNDHAKVLSKMRDEKGAWAEWVRVAFVGEYFLTRIEKEPLKENALGWKDYCGEDITEFKNNIKSEFCRRYIWFYHRAEIKQLQIKSDRYVYKIKLNEFCSIANQWLVFFMECRRYFQKNYSAYWKDMLKNILLQYDIDQRIDRLKYSKRIECAEEINKIREQFQNYIHKPYSEIIPDANMVYSESVSDGFELVEHNYKSNRFDKDIVAAQYFQNQKCLCALGEKNNTINQKVKKETFPMPKREKSFLYAQEQKTSDSSWQFHVYSLSELLFYMGYCYDKLNKVASDDQCLKGQRKSTSIWFRGHTSESYRLVPTVMRNYRDDNIKRFCTLRNYHQSNYEEFKFRADGAPEMPNGLRFTRSDYIAMMQHYCAPTNFLDWTENAFTSLYLALHYFFEENEAEYRNVTLSIFHPGIYNYTRFQRLQHLQNNLMDSEEIRETLKKVAAFDDNYVTLVPNLSMKQNEEKYDMFLLGNCDMEIFLLEIVSKLNEMYGDTDVPNKMQTLFMPMAVLTSRLNPRIRTQCGCFVAYNVYTPSLSEIKAANRNVACFDYVSLEEIQKSNETNNIFLYRIIIDKECCAEVVHWLKSLGVSRENIYPELSEKGYYFS